MFHSMIFILILTGDINTSQFIPRYNCEAGLEDYDMMRSLERDVCETKHMNIVSVSRPVTV